MKVIVKQAKVVLLGRLGVQRNLEFEPDGIPLVKLYWSLMLYMVVSDVTDVTLIIDPSG